VAPTGALAAPPAEGTVDLVITTYGQLQCLPWVGEVEWDLVVLDEAQAVKNPGAKQARAVKALRCRGRVGLTGTPIESRLADLWSLFDFLNPGLLGSARAFTRVTTRLAREGHHYGPLRALVRPYILRRLKTDRRVIADSGKFARLQALVEEIASRQDKVLVFTQFRELTGPLAAHLGRIFGRPGLVLHGETPVRQRMALVERFQTDETVPFFVLSLKAGGTGLNLTAATQVIHFDRWWNPAVESQATDRAFRIGQRRGVVVHKFVCRGTVEERIDALIEGKTELAAEILAEGGEPLITEMSDEEILRLVRLDLEAATAVD